MDPTATTANAPGTRLSSSVAYVLESSDDVPDVRERLGTWIRSHAPDIDELRLYEILLAANELMSNAFEHGSGRACNVEIEALDGAAVVAVTNETAEFKPKSTDDWHMPDASSRTGRGLAIVKNVADDVDVHSDRSHVRIAARFDFVREMPANASNDATLTE